MHEQRTRAGASAEAPGLLRWGLRGWLFLGVVLAAAAVVWMLSRVSGLVVPLVIATVLSALFAPLVDVAHRRRVPRQVGALLVLLALVAAVVGSVWLLLAAVVDQAPQISAQVRAGLDVLGPWLDARGIGSGSTSATESDLGGLVKSALGGAGAHLPGALSSVVSFLFGATIALFLLYYVLVDWHRLCAWVATRLGLDPVTGAGVVDDAVSTIRQYYATLTASAVVTAVLIGASAALLDVPLALTIAVITLVTSYVPYLGAIVSGTFATLVALGSAGPGTAVVLLVVVLVVQNVVQTAVLARLNSDVLSLHPVVTLGSTVVGAALAGALGATLSSPVVAMVLRVRRRLAADQE